MSALDDYFRTLPADSPDPAAIRAAARGELQQLVDRAWDAVKVVEDLVGEAQLEVRDTLKEYFREQRAELERRIDQQAEVGQTLGDRTREVNVALRRLDQRIAELDARKPPPLPEDLVRTAQLERAKSELGRAVTGIDRTVEAAVVRVARVEETVTRIGQQVGDVDSRLRDLGADVKKQFESVRKSVRKSDRLPGGFGGAAAVSNEAYDSTGWNDVNAVAPSKGAVRDAIEALSGAYVARDGDLDDLSDKASARVNLGVWQQRPLTPVPIADKEVITTFASGHGFTASGAASSNLNDTTDFVIGSQAAKLVSAGTGTAALLSKVGGTAIDATGMSIGIVLKVDDLTHQSFLRFYLGTGNFASYYEWSYTGASGQRFHTDGDWALITLNFGDATVTGTPDRSALTDVRLRLEDDAAGAVTIHYNEIFLVPEPPAPVISISCDDADASQFTVMRPKLDQYGFPATAYVICDMIGTGGRLTEAQLLQLQNMSGWEIGGHSYTNADHTTRFTGLTAAQIRSNLQNMREWLLARGFTGGDHFAWPGGIFDGDTIAEVRKYVSSARAILSSTARGIETIPPADPMKIRTLDPANLGLTAAQVITRIDAAIANNGWLNIVFHEISAAATGGVNFNTTDFNTVIDYIASKNVEVRLASDVLRQRRPSKLDRTRTRSVKVTGTQVTSTAVTTEQTMLTFKLPTNVKAGDQFRLIASGDLLNNTGAGQTFNVKVKIGTTMFWGTGAWSAGTSGSRRWWELNADIWLISAASQKGRVRADYSSPGTTTINSALAYSSGMFGPGTASEDLLAGKDLAVTVTLSDATTDFRVQNSSLTLIPA